MGTVNCTHLRPSAPEIPADLSSGNTSPSQPRRRQSLQRPQPAGPLRGLRYTEAAAIDAAATSSSSWRACRMAASIPRRYLPRVGGETGNGWDGEETRGTGVLFVVIQDDHSMIGRRDSFRRANRGPHDTPLAANHAGGNSQKYPHLQRLSKYVLLDRPPQALQPNGHEYLLADSFGGVLQYHSRGKPAAAGAELVSGRRPDSGLPGCLSRYPLSRVENKRTTSVFSLRRKDPATTFERRVWQRRVGRRSPSLRPQVGATRSCSFRHWWWALDSPPGFATVLLVQERERAPIHSHRTSSPWRRSSTTIPVQGELWRSRLPAPSSAQRAFCAHARGGYARAQSAGLVRRPSVSDKKRRNVGWDSSERRPWYVASSTQIQLKHARIKWPETLSPFTVVYPLKPA